MKKFTLLFVLVTVLSSVAFSQTAVPQKMSFQAVVRNSSNVLVANQSVGIRVSILQGSATGTAAYVETQSGTTNANGLVSLEIGNGAVQVGSFAGINWGNGPFYIKTETDPSGGSNYTITATSQLLSVPYALYAGSTVYADSSYVQAHSATTKININQSGWAPIQGVASWALAMGNNGITIAPAHSTGDNIAAATIITPLQNGNSKSAALLEAPLFYKTFETNLWRIHGQYQISSTATGNVSTGNGGSIALIVRSIGSGATVYAENLIVPAAIGAGTQLDFTVFFPTIADATSAGQGYTIEIDQSNNGVNYYTGSPLVYQIQDVTRTNF
ncbi:MAG TPA: hypothetical protein VGB84_00375 [Arachidicoccus sp.]